MVWLSVYRLPPPDLCLCISESLLRPPFSPNLLTYSCIHPKHTLLLPQLSCGVIYAYSLLLHTTFVDPVKHVQHFTPKGPLKEASKFAQQLSGAVNEKVMGVERSTNPAADTPDMGMGMGTEAPWEGAEGAAAAAAGGATGVGMAKGWQPPTTEPGMGMAKELELANDVPSELDAASDSAAELSIDEQVCSDVDASRGASGI